MKTTENSYNKDPDENVLCNLSTSCCGNAVYAEGSIARYKCECAYEIKPYTLYFFVLANVTKMAVYKVVSFMIVIVMVMLKAHGLSDIEAIEAQARRYEVAYGAGDIETVQSLYTEDCRVFPTGALPYTGRESN